ncbi:hypothetical protein [Muriicola marianensis]|uniref:Uncharacterized protein n=1 Tax=Muriicola marianensis TaxID=1324801 RepID=A0ABQ1QRT7_9FLAO|nr:hypothetical protein [Muriicola marianensis]GGD42807.1 hypothetical protein GCM10011361_07230 [Muriicola marianensis]
MDNTIYYVLGLVAVIYIALSTFNRRRSKERKSRKFMDGYQRKKKEE